jgi:TetR/AcrR family transcriptional regulator, transcriptional repressor for nem operon
VPVSPVHHYCLLLGLIRTLELICNALLKFGWVSCKLIEKTDRSLLMSLRCMTLSKAQLTRSHIIHQAAEVFNQYGYARTSLADLMQATGLKKGGIYNHFASKDELAIAAFDYSVGLIQQRYAEALRAPRLAVDRLYVVVDTFCKGVVSEPVLKGGCPLMNTAIDSDDAHEGLRLRAQMAMNRWRTMLRKIVVYGQKHGEILATVEADEVATIVIATLEGAVMMSGLYGDRTYLESARSHLMQYIDALQASS